MADEILDPRCYSRLRQAQITTVDNRSRTKKPRPVTSSILLNFLLILLLVIPLLFQPVEPASRAIKVCRKQERDCMQVTPWPRHIQVTRSNPRRLSTELNQFSVPAASSRGQHARRSPVSPWANSWRYNTSAHQAASSRGQHARRSPVSPWANSWRYNASAHQVPIGPNPTPRA